MSLLVMSCDRYADLWNPMSDCLKRFWPDCPYEILLSTESLNPAPETAFHRVIHSGSTAWSGRLLDSLNAIETPYTMLLLDDLWPCQSISTAAIEQILNLMERDAIGDVHLRNEGTDQRDYEKDSAYRVYTSGAPYRISASASVWNTAFLKSVLRPEESAWEFERIGSYREEALELPVLVCKNSPLSVVCDSGAVEQGKWEPRALAFAKEQGILVDSTKRPVKSWRDRLKKSIRSIVYNVNPKLILAIQNRIYRAQQCRKK
jgi:hypothetical protein